MNSSDETQPKRRGRQEPLPLRDAAAAVLRMLVDAGFVAYFAGGCVRDRLMGIDPTDYDIATDGRPEQIRDIFPHAQAVGEAFGVMLVRHSGHTFEVATFRSDGKYSDGRHPDSVTFTDAIHDAARRDFTINGIFEDPIEDCVHDFVDGQADIANRIVRAIGDPKARLREDRLRMLRAVRFAARFGFTIEPETAEAIRTDAHELRGVSRERVGHEIRKMLLDANRGVAAWELQYLGLDEAVLGEPSVTVAPTHLGRLPEVTAYPTALAGWILDRHAPGGNWPLVIDRWAGRLVLSNAERTGLWNCLEVYPVLMNGWEELGVARQKRLAASNAFGEALALVQCTQRQRFVDLRRRVIELARTELAPTPLLDGNALIAAGFEPGPAFKTLLDAVYDAQLEGSISSPEEALRLARMLEDADESTR